MTSERWEPLARAYQDMIFRLAFSTLRHTEDAQDVTQDVLLRLLEVEDCFSGEEHIRAWLIRVTVNRCRDVLRSPWKRKRAELPEQMIGVQVSREEGITLLEAVGKLPPKLRLVIHLYYYEQYNTVEIADLTKQSPAAVRQQLSRARKLLRLQLKEALE